MRFLIGLALGFGAGFAGAVLFAPERPKRHRVNWPPGTVEAGPAAFEEDHNIMASVRHALRTLQEQVREAMEEAKRAQQEAERELRSRYEKTARRKAGDEGK